jgi:DNA-binding GntR family transcriptional regulator
MHKGYRIAPPISDAQLEALYDARLVLEVGATELAARNAATVVPLLTAALDEQRKIAQRIEEGAAAGGVTFDLVREYFTVDWEFHRQIFQSTNNPFLIDMSESISTRIHRMRQSVDTGVRDTMDALAEHGRIAAAFEEGAEAAGEAMRDHIERVRIRSRSDAIEGAREPSERPGRNDRRIP